VRHRQTKGAATDMFDLQPPRHISTLRNLVVPARSGEGRLTEQRAVARPRPRERVFMPHSGLPLRPSGTTGALESGRLIVPPQNFKAARSTVLVGPRPRHFCGTNAYFLVWIVADPPHNGYAAASINSITGEHWPVGMEAPTLCLPAEPISRFRNDAAGCSTKSAEASRACRLVPRLRRARRRALGD